MGTLIGEGTALAIRYLASNKHVSEFTRAVFRGALAAGVRHLRLRYLK